MSLDAARADAQRLNVLLQEWHRSGCKGANPFRTPESSGMTLGDLVEAYCSRRLAEHAKSPEKAVWYARWQLERYLADWKPRALTTITRAAVATLHFEIARKYARKGRPAKMTANGVVDFLRAIFNWASRENLYKGENPAARIERHQKKPRARFLQPDEVARLYKALDECENAYARDFTVLALETAARRSNICGMRWEEINWTLATWTIPDPKNRHPQTVELTHEALAVLRRRHEGRKEPSNWVFPGRGKREHLVNPAKAWAKICAAAKITGATIHDLRRTRASYMALAGASLLQIGAVLGHRNPQSTAVYARLNQQAQREAQELGARKMAALVAEAQKSPKQLGG